MPLNELRNQARPLRRPEKVYGKRKCVMTGTRNLHRDLFGTDENEIEWRLGTLTISTEEDTVLQSSRQPLKSSPRKESPHQLGQKSPQKLLSVSPRGSTQKSPQKATSVTVQKKRVKEGRSGLRRPRRLRKMQKITPEEARHLEPLLKLIRDNAQVKDFGELGASILARYELTKVGEGSFGDCFFLRSRDPLRPITGVLKVIAFNAICGGDSTSNLEDVVQEAKILKGLESVHGFAQGTGMHVVRGRYHRGFIDAAEEFERTHESAEDTRDALDSHAEDQFNLVIEMEYAGTDLERLANPSAFEAYDAFWMVVILLANAEEKLEFEHRDLHLSNICFQSVEDRSEAQVSTMQERPTVTLGLSRLRISIIDYTMSRAKLDSGEIVYRVLDQQDPIEGLDRLGSHQRTTGLRMREWIKQQGVIQAAIGDNEKNYCPKTNVIWLGHTLFGLLHNAQESGENRKVESSNAVALEFQETLWNGLKEVQQLIDIDHLDSLPDGADELLRIGIERGWVKQEDVCWFGEYLG